MNLRLLLILIIFSQLVYSCGTEEDPKKISLTSEKWMLENITAGKVSEYKIRKPGDYTLRLDNSGKFKINSDCNKCSGKYTVASKFIKFTEIDCSKKLCGKGSYDYLFRTYTEKASSFKIKGKELWLKSFKGSLKFSAK